MNPGIVIRQKGINVDIFCQPAYPFCKVSTKNLFIEFCSVLVRENKSLKIS
jgi:hypothetical protein